MATKIPYVNEAWNPFSEVQFLPERLDQPLHWRRPRDIIVCSQSDLFHEKVDDERIYSVMMAMYLARHHRYFIFTKRIERAKSFFDLFWRTTTTFDYWKADNVWLMLSISTRKEADEKIPILIQTNVAHRGLSIEPDLEDISLRWGSWARRARDSQGGMWLNGKPVGSFNEYDALRMLDWVIVGCESGAKRRPCPMEAIRGVVKQCQEAGVPVWCKQLEVGGIVRHEMKYFPEELRIQQKP